MNIPAETVAEWSTVRAELATLEAAAEALKGIPDGNGVLRHHIASIEGSAAWKQAALDAGAEKYGVDVEEFLRGLAGV